jgi:thioester reductase-like protein
MSDQSGATGPPSAVGHIAEQARRTGTVFVTGATGFLGGELLLTLLRADDRPIICVVRADDQAAAEQRGAERLATLARTAADGHRLSSWTNRVTWIRGDLETPRLGWDAATWQDVARRVVELYHCAASVSFDLPLAEAQRINVDGTRHVYELATAASAAHGIFKRFHHVSTAYVAGTSKGRVVASHLPTDRPENFRNTYERTKARAERFLREQHLTSGAIHAVPTSIYRPSIVTGHSTDGRTDNWNVLYVPMKFASRGQLPVFRHGGPALVDIVGVDFVVQAMVELGRQSTESLESFHVTGCGAARPLGTIMAETVEAAHRHGSLKPSSTRMLRPRQWTALGQVVNVGARLPKRLGAATLAAKAMKAGLDLCGVYVPYTEVASVFDTQREEQMLQGTGIAMPEPAAYFRTILTYALATNYGRVSVPHDVVDIDGAVPQGHQVDATTPAAAA